MWAPPPLQRTTPTTLRRLARSLACSERGAETIRHFLYDIAKLTGDWKMEDVLNEEMEKIRRQVSGWK